jgi:hypothetical protein
MLYFATALAKTAAIEKNLTRDRNLHKILYFPVVLLEE